jgi:hypothetical protein
MSRRRIGPGERADGVVVFNRPPFKQSNETLFLQMAETGGKGWAGAAVLSPSLRQEKALRLYRLLNGSPRDRVNNLGIEIRPQAQDRGLVRRIEAGQAKNSLFMLALHHSAVSQPGIPQHTRGSR